LFVEAGAGSGKTTALVTRVVALVTSGAAELANVAAITFTDKAAGELRDRVRPALEQAADADPSSQAGRRALSATHRERSLAMAPRPI
jgi:ATP-dependent helicase/nuclease subunit A